MRKLLVALSGTALLGAVVAVIALLTGAVALVETHGNSMAPRITAGDLVIVRASTSYRVGDVVAYTSADLGRVVLHRVVSIHDGRYTFRGDHNDFGDPEQPTRDQLIGTELVRIPGGGLWLDRLTSPIALGILTFGLIAGGGTTVETRRRRRKKTGKATMSQHAAPTRSARRATGWPPRLRTAATIAAITGVAGLALGAVAWTQPTNTEQTAPGGTVRTMTFSYQADVAASPAYDDTLVTAPEPIFRQLTDQVDLLYTYRGDPGTLTVAAELSTASGWHSTVPLQPAVTFDDTYHTGTVYLDLNRLDARAQAAAEAIGIPVAQVEVAVVPTMTTVNGETFAPRLAFTLTPMQFTLLGGQPALTVTDTAATGSDDAGTNTLGIAGYQLSVSALRVASGVLTLTGVLLLGLLGLTLARTSTNEAATIKRRYPTLLLSVEPVTSPPGRPVVDVTEFPALARLAERYGLLVMHWTRSDVETYVVHDDGITYRYRTGTGHSQARSDAEGQRSVEDMSGRPA